MTTRLTWQEIRKTYPDEWVLLVDYHISGREPIDGVVLDHARVRKEVLQRSKSVSARCAFIYTGEKRHGLVGLHVIDVDKPSRSRGQAH